jgi:hypothetical protein
MYGRYGFNSGFSTSASLEPECHDKAEITAYIIVQECEHEGDMEDTFRALKTVPGVRVVNWTAYIEGEYETGAVAINATAEQIAKLSAALEEEGRAHVTTYAPERWTGRSAW